VALFDRPIAYFVAVTIGAAWFPSQTQFTLSDPSRFT
jgi:hypothetical protein